MRNSLGKKKLRKYSRLHGREFVEGLTRGNTRHRFDLYAADGTKVNYWPSNGYTITTANDESWQREGYLVVAADGSASYREKEAA